MLSARLAGSRRAENQAGYERLQLIAELWEAWRPDEVERAADHRAGRRDLSREALHEDLVTTEVAAALGLSEYAAAQRVDAAVALLVDRRLPLADRLCGQGELDWARLNALLSRTRDLPVEQARAVEERVLQPAVVGLTIGRFMDAVDRAVLAVDPAAAARRRKATVEGRGVSFRKDPAGADAACGTATLTAYGPADGLTVAMACVDAAARALRAAGDPRTVDQLRFDLLVTACTTGRLPVPQDLLPVRLGPDGQPVRPDRSAAHAAALAASEVGPTPATAPPSGEVAGLLPVEPVVVRSTCRPPVRADIVVLVSEKTLAGLNDEPAHLQGYGPISAEMARDLAREGIWRCAAVDDTHATVIGVGRTTWTPGYVPGKALRDFLVVAARSCTVPWCTVPAERCDLDHRTPYASGGATCICTVAPLCRTHHREKTAGDLVLEASADPAHPHGTVVLATKGGLRFVVMPDAPLPPEAFAVTVDPTDDPPPF